MDVTKQRRFDQLYQRHLRMLKLQGLSDKTIDVYARAVRRIAKHFDCCPDRLTPEQLEVYFGLLVDSHSWSTVKVDRNGLQFFWRHVLKLDWQWVNIIKPPKIQTIPDVLTVSEVDQLIGTARKLRYQVFFLTTYSMGLRLGETLSLQVGDIDAGRRRVHVRRGKGCKDRLVPLPETPIRPCAPCGAPIVIPLCCSLALRARLKPYVRQHPIWIAAVSKKPSSCLLRSVAIKNSAASDRVLKEL